jgi:hypothetical protein
MRTRRKHIVKGHTFRNALLLLMGIAAPAVVRADRRSFLYTYSPNMEAVGEAEVEAWATVRLGKQDAAGTLWEPRAEFEYALTRRLSAAAYLNLVKESDHPVKLESASAEWILGLAKPGALPGDPALYLETTAASSEYELEPKLLLGREHGHWVTAVNLIGEFEFRRNNEELLSNGEVLHRAAAGELAGGVAYEATPHLSFGIESRYRTEHPNFGPEAVALFSVGPNVNLQFGELQLGVAFLSRVWGRAGTNGGGDLDDFERSQMRVLLGLGL